jgi:hypothetical protein
MGRTSRALGRSRRDVAQAAELGVPTVRMPVMKIELAGRIGRSGSDRIALAPPVSESGAHYRTPTPGASARGRGARKPIVIDGLRFGVRHRKQISEQLQFRRARHRFELTGHVSKISRHGLGVVCGRIYVFLGALVLGHWTVPHVLEAETEICPGRARAQRKYRGLTESFKVFRDRMSRLLGRSATQL